MLYADETLVWRFALPRRGWWRRAQRYRLPTRPLSPSQIKAQETLKRQAWTQYRTWSRITSGVVLHVIGAVQYTGKEVVMVTDRSGIHRAHKLTSTLDHYRGQFQLQLLPAHCCTIEHARCS